MSRPIDPFTFDLLRIISWNIEGLYKNLASEETRNFILDSDLIGLSETWVTGTPPNLPGMSLIGHRKAKRSKTRGRASSGICVYARSTAEFTVREIVLDDHSSENYIWVELSASNNKVAICFAYNPPSSSLFKNDDFFKSLSESLEETQLDMNVNYYSILGDFNARVGDLEDLSLIHI